jgi:hypothetical protein
MLLAALSLCIVETMPAQQPAASNAAPDADAPTADPAAAAKRIKQTGPGQYELGEVKFSSVTREVRVPTTVNMRDGAIEFALVHEMGKTHESLLKMTASAVDIQVALLLCNYQAGELGLISGYEKDLEIVKRVETTAPKTAGANRVKIAVEWKDADGKIKRMSLQEWMIEVNTKKPPTDVTHWIFNGSSVMSAGFAAELQGNTIAIYMDRNAVLSWPGKSNRDDDHWLPNTSVIPKEDTPITLIISPDDNSNLTPSTKP